VSTSTASPRGIAHPKSLTSHVLSNVLIDVKGDTAFVESYATTFARVKSDGERYDCFVGARILDHMERRDGRWAASPVASCFGVDHDVPVSETWVLGMLAPDASAMRMGTKFPEDPVFAG